MIQATTTLLATPHRTEDVLRAVPAPMMQPVMVCVVDTGMPNADAVKTMIDPPRDALNP